MVCKSDLSPKDLKTLRLLDREIRVQTANGMVIIKETADIYVMMLNMTVRALVLPNTAHVLSLGMLCTIHGYIHHWYCNETPYLEKNSHLA